MSLQTSPSGVIAISAILPAIGIVAVALRFYTRYQQKTSLAIDDWLTLPALVLTIAMGAVLIAGVKAGAFAHATPGTGAEDPNGYLLSESPEEALDGKLAYAFILLQILSLGLVKLSVLFFYRRIFCINSLRTVFNVVNTFMIVAMFLWTMTFFFISVFVCGLHFDAQWTSVAKLETYCPILEDFDQGFAISDLLSDLLILILPIPAVWGLQLSVTKKISVICVFMLGAVATAASITRQVLAAKEADLYDPNQDPDQQTTIVLYWSMMESGLVLIAACLPSLWHLVAKHIPVHLPQTLRKLLTIRTRPANSVRISDSDTQYGPLSSTSSSFSRAQIVHSRPKDVEMMMLEARVPE